MARQTMKAVVVDTSVIVKWFSRERDVESALRLREDLVDARVLVRAPDLLLVELANALRFHPKFSAEDAAAAVDSVVNAGVGFIRVTAGLLRSATKLAFDRNLTVYDAVFAALAATEKAPLVTADEKLAGKIGPACDVLPLGRYGFRFEPEISR